VAIDDADGTVELQHFDGTIEELEMAAWWDQDLDLAQAPEDWSGSVDVDFEDMPEPDTRGFHGWVDPLEYLDRYD